MIYIIYACVHDVPWGHDAVTCQSPVNREIVSFWRLQYAGTVAGFGFDRQVCDILHSNILNSDVFEYECICTPYSAEDDIGGVVVGIHPWLQLYICILLLVRLRTEGSAVCI